MTWRRLLFSIVYVVTFVPLWVLFVCGYLGEGILQRLERLEQWSKRSA